jgi:hypothetical protein
MRESDKLNYKNDDIFEESELKCFVQVLKYINK